MPAGLMIGALALGFAAVCAALMGYAAQRGGTCMVAAVDEVVSQGRGSRLLALAEASVWVAVGLLIAARLGLSSAMPPAYAATALSVAGGALLGAGALANRACAVGTIARLGSGEWAYLLTPLGFLAGCASAGPFLQRFAPAPAAGASPLFAAPLWAAAPVAVWLAWRLARIVRHGWRRPGDPEGWSPHQATTVIGVGFVGLALAAGGWAYTGLLAQAARGMSMGLAAQAVLFVALAAGAILGGWRGRRLRRGWPPPMTLARCFGGGWLMGVGSLLVPGGNDRLVLLGLPLLQANAWVAIPSMVAVIAGGLWLRRALAPRPAAIA